MKRTICAHVMLILSIIELNAQIKINDWDELKSIDLKRKVIGIGIQGGIEGSNGKLIQNQINGGIWSNTKSTISLSSLNSYYTYRTSSMAKQKSWNIHMIFSLIKADPNFNPSTVCTQAYELGITNQVKSYFNQFFYFQHDFQVNHSIYRSLTKNLNFNHINSSSLTNISLPLAIGYGRMDETQDAMVANYLINELNKKHILATSLNHDEIIEFTQLISESLNQRKLNHFISESSELISLENYLQAKQLLNISTEFKKTVDPIWKYAIMPLRYSGYRFSIGATPSVGSTNSFVGLPDQVNMGFTPIEKSYWYVGISPKVSLEYSKPINLNWQHDIAFELKYEKLHFINGDAIDDNPAFLTSGIQYGLTYFPGIKSMIKFDLSAKKYYHNDTHLKIQNWTANLGVDYHLRISPEFEFNAQYKYFPAHTIFKSLFSNFSNTIKVYDNITRLNIGLIYKIY